MNREQIDERNEENKNKAIKPYRLCALCVCVCVIIADIQLKYEHHTTIIIQNNETDDEIIKNHKIILFMEQYK